MKDSQHKRKETSTFLHSGKNDWSKTFNMEGFTYAEQLTAIKEKQYGKRAGGYQHHTYKGKVVAEKSVRKRAEDFR